MTAYGQEEPFAKCPVNVRLILIADVPLAPVKGRTRPEAVFCAQQASDTSQGITDRDHDRAQALLGIDPAMRLRRMLH